jgi:hypothetical protein
MPVKPATTTSASATASSVFAILRLIARVYPQRARLKTESVVDGR